MAHAEDAEIDLIKDVNMAHAGGADIDLIKDVNMNDDKDTDMALVKEAAKPLIKKRKKAGNDVHAFIENELKVLLSARLLLVFETRNTIISSVSSVFTGEGEGEVGYNSATEAEVTKAS